MTIDVLVANKLATLAENMRAHQLTTIVGSRAYDTCRAISALTIVDEQSVRALEFGDEIWDHFHELTTEKEQLKLAAKRSRYEAKAEVRATYLPTSSMTIQAAKKDGVPYWRFHMDLDAPGLMTYIAQHKGVDTTKPIALQLFNQLPFKKRDDGTETRVRMDIHDQEYQFLSEEGYRVSKDKVAWRWNMVKDLFTTAFPTAIEFSAYNHRFRSPLLPGGFFHSQKVAFHDVMTWRVEDTPDNALREALGLHGQLTLEEDILQGVDGSGLYDPDHSAVAHFVSQYGKVPMQITLLTEDGLVGKGILVPRENLAESMNLDVDTPWFFDHLQVKGKFKDVHKKLHGTGQVVVYPDCYIGVMKAWNKRATMPAGFEQFENVGPAKRPDESFTDYLIRRKQVIQDIRSLVQEGMDRLFDGGVDRLLAAVANDDPNLKTLIDFVNRAREQERNNYVDTHGSDEGFEPTISALQIPMVNSAISDRLQSKLWVQGQGAGIKGRQLVIVIDASLEEGTSVVKGVDAGTKSAIWRFPTITSCGLVVTTAVDPAPHHLVEGQVIPNTVFMNPRDVLKFQGDDDGDIVGFSTDERIVRLWENRLDDRFYNIEPEGTKFKFSTNSAEGWKYINHDPRGPVGICTIAIANLRAVGDHDGALGAAVLNQEAIDSAKKSPHYTNWVKASNPSNWKLCTDKTYHIHWFKIGEDYYPNSRRSEFESVDEESDNWWGTGEFPLEEFSTWVDKRLNAHGCERSKKRKCNPLGWRIHEVPKTNQHGKEVMVRVKKRIPPTSWKPCNEKQNGWTGGNWVHYIHDLSLEHWKQRYNGFMDGDKEQLEMPELIPRLLKSVGINMDPKMMLWDKYLALRDKSGLSKFGKELKKILSSVHDVDERVRRINSTQANLNSDLARMELHELVAIWKHEQTPVYGFKHSRQSNKEYTYDQSRVPDGAIAYLANKPNHAFRAVTHPKSPILVLLGIEPEEQCDFLEMPARTARTKLQAVVNWSFTKQNPYATLAKLVHADKSHSLHNKDGNGHGIELHECNTCRTALQDAFVRNIRDAHKSKETVEMRELIAALRNKPRDWQLKTEVQQLDDLLDEEQYTYE